MSAQKDEKAPESRWNFSSNNNIFIIRPPLEFTRLKKVGQGFKTLIKGLDFRDRPKVEVHIYITCVPTKIWD